MILGVVDPGSAHVPTWFSSLGVRSIGTTQTGIVHVGKGEGASSAFDGALTVAAEAGTVRRGGRYASAVAEAYRRFGIGCIKHLPGRFRFVLHDADAGLLIAGCSTAPPWPLAYWSDSRTTIISSRLLPMLHCPEVSRALDESYLVHLVMGLSAMPDGLTPIRGIRRLRTGEALVVDANGAHVSRVDRLTPTAVAGNRAQLGRAFVEELGKAVAASVRRERSVISLSGGLDSAAILSSGLKDAGDLAALAFVAPALDSTAEIESIHAMERAWPQLHVMRVDASDAGDLPDLGTELRDDPPLTPLALLPARALLWSRAREGGFQTVIEGEGGDELFSMLPSPLDAMRSGHLLTAAGHVLRASGRRALVENGLWLPHMPGLVRRAWLQRRHPIDTELPAFAVWGAADRPAIRDAVHEYLETLVHRPFAARLEEWLSAPTVVGAALSRRHVAGGFGLELEWPMLDRGVLELVIGLHDAGAIDGAPDKPFLQDALAGLLPDDVRLRAKDIGLYNAFIPRVLTSPRARQAVRDARVHARLADWVRFDRLEGMLDRLAAGQSLRKAALWQLECVVSFAEWYVRASSEYGVS
jgi:asparagine synthase (glutamine-hydrolysing)